jgi:hypothetical protein
MYATCGSTSTDTKGHDCVVESIHKWSVFARDEGGRIGSNCLKDMGFLCLQNMSKHVLELIEVLIVQPCECTRCY